jgi:iron(III) transport system substrate-binding protein
VLALVVVVIILAGVAAYAFTLSGTSKTITTTVTSNGNGGGTSGPSYDMNATLVNLAKQEGGSLTAYTPFDSGTLQNLTAAFKQAFPWANPNLLSVPSNQLVAKAASEYKAGKVSADIIMGSIASSIAPAVADGIVQPFNDSVYLYALGYPASLINQYGTPAFALPGVIAYNTALVSPQNAPTSIQSFTNSFWQGKITMQDPSVMGNAGCTLLGYLPAMGNQSWTTMIQQINANKPIYTSGGGGAMTNIQTGQAAAGIVDLDDFLAGQSTYKNVSVVFTNPTVEILGEAAMTKNAPHPYMAELFLQWIASLPAQKVIADSGRFPANPAALLPFQKSIIPNNVTIQPEGFEFTNYYAEVPALSAMFHNSMA